MDNELYRVLRPFVLIAIILAAAIARFLKNDPSKGDVPITPKQQRKIYGPLIGNLDGKLEGKFWGLLGGYKFIGQYRGHSFSVYIGLNGKRNDVLFMRSTPVSIRISLSLPHESEIRILVYGTSPWLVPFLNKVQIYDLECRPQFYVYSNLPDRARVFLQDGTRRESIRKLVAAGWMEKRLSKMVLGKRDLQVVRNYKPSYADPNFIKETLDCLSVLAEGL